MKDINKKRVSLLALVAVTIIWGSGFIATEEAIRSQIGTDAIMTIRFALASFIIGIINIKGVLKTKKSELIHGIVAGTLVFIAFYVQTLGQASTDISLVALITSSNVVLVPFFIWIFQKKKPSNMAFLFAFLTMLGMIILNWKNDGIEFSMGSLLVFLCALIFAMHIAYLGVKCRNDNVLALTFWQLFTAAVLSAILWAIKGSIFTAEQFKQGIGSILYLALFSTCLCYFLQTMAQQNIPAENAGIILSIEGVFGAAFSIILGYEALRHNVVIGGLIVMFCAVAVNINFGRQTNKSQ